MSVAAEWSWLGRVPFEATADRQERLREDILAAKRPEILLLCEHEPVITLGRSAREEHVLTAACELRRRGIDVRRASRGGDVTYHGPGQLVGYPVFRLRTGVLAHVEGIAAAVRAVLLRLGIEAEWRRACPGLWVGAEKICAFGVHVRRRVAVHGFALNVSTDLDAFSAIVPCGLRGSGVTSVAALKGSAPTVDELSQEMAAAFERAFGVVLGRV